MTKVLVVDHEAQIRRILRAEFELHGFFVIEAENAAAGLRAATMNAPDLIVLDANLPDLEGSEVVERIRSWSNVPVIVSVDPVRRAGKGSPAQTWGRRLRRETVRNFGIVGTKRGRAAPELAEHQ